MQIVSDHGMDLTHEQMQGLSIHLVPLTLTLDGKSYRSGVDIDPAEFYRLLSETESFPTTSQPSPGDFAEIYRTLAQTDPEILSIHISSGLSGTLNAAKTGATLVPEAHVTFVDSHTLSGALGWQVQAAAQAAHAGWDMTRILALLETISRITNTVYTLATLKYLIHGGRISHLKGLVGSVLNLKPLIGVEKTHGTYVTYGQARSLDKAVLKICDHVQAHHAPGTTMRFQVLHGHNLEGAALLEKRLAEVFQCTWLPVGSIAPVLGAHTGPGLVGLAYASQAEWPPVPE